MPSTTLILDADVLIKLAQTPENRAIIAAMAAAVSNGTYALILPECVVNAYHREKTTAADRYWNSLRAAIKNFRALSIPLGEAERIATLAKELGEKVDKLKNGVPDTIHAVDALVKLSPPVPHSDADWADAAKRYRDAAVPGARTMRSSITDCILWRVVERESQKAPVIFCTDNKHDFSDPKHDEKLHPDLIAELGDNKYCYHSLANFQKHHFKATPVVVTEYTVRCAHCGLPTQPGLIMRPSAYGGWSDQRFCSHCGGYTDLGELSDEG